MSLFFRLAYLFGVKPWDSGVPPPELEEVIEGPHALKPGRALDLGCGTGTNCIYLAQHGWEATGVDLIGRPIDLARRKALKAATHARFLRGDVTRLPELQLGGSHDLVLDLGCCHSLQDGSRDRYADGVAAESAPGATFLLYGFFGGGRGPGPVGLAEDEVEVRFGPEWQLLWTRKSEPFPGRTAAWYRMHRRG